MQSHDTIKIKPLSHTTEYRAWKHMLSRCYNPKDKDYHLYGARGITVDPAWVGSFRMFLVDMGERPTDAHSLDRINNDRGYGKDNCRWARPNRQARNRRTNVMITHDGVTRCVAEWAEIYRVPMYLLHSRVVRSGWDFERAISTPIDQNMSKAAKSATANEPITIDGVTHTRKEWAKIYGISYDLVNIRVRQLGFTPLQAITTPVRKNRGRRTDPETNKTV